MCGIIPSCILDGAASYAIHACHEQTDIYHHICIRQLPRMDGTTPSCSCDWVKKKRNFDQKYWNFRLIKVGEEFWSIFSVKNWKKNLGNFKFSGLFLVSSVFQSFQFFQKFKRNWMFSFYIFLWCFSFWKQILSKEKQVAVNAINHSLEFSNIYLQQKVFIQNSFPLHEFYMKFLENCKKKFFNFWFSLILQIMNTNLSQIIVNIETFKNQNRHFLNF